MNDKETWKHKRRETVWGVLGLSSTAILTATLIGLAVWRACQTGWTDWRYWVLIGVATLFGGFLTGITYKSVLSNYYWPETSECLRANSVELAEWLANNPRYGNTTHDRQTQTRIREYLTANQTQLQQPLTKNNADALIGLMSICFELESADEPITVYRTFNSLIRREPQHWRAFDESYRDTMFRVANGESIRGATVIIHTGR